VAELSEIGYQFEERNFRFLTPFTGIKGGFHMILNELDDRIAKWEQAVADRGVDVRFETTAQSLIVEDGAVTGVNAVDAEGVKTAFKGKAVVLAAGGYLGNRELQQRFIKTDKLNVAKGGESLCTGDTILAAEAIGVALEKTYGYCPCEYGHTNSKATRPAKQDKYDQNTAF